MEYFPSLESGSTYEDKVKFLSRCSAIWNCYGVPYNQSGVTGDCIFSNVPCIVSKFEPFTAVLSNMNLLIELDIERDDEELFNTILAALRDSEEGEKGSDSGNKSIASFFGGEEAFKRYWLPIFTVNSK